MREISIKLSEKRSRLDRSSFGLFSLWSIVDLSQLICQRPKAPKAVPQRTDGGGGRREEEEEDDAAISRSFSFIPRSFVRSSRRLWRLLKQVDANKLLAMFL